MRVLAAARRSPPQPAAARRNPPQPAWRSARNRIDCSVNGGVLYSARRKQRELTRRRAMRFSDLATKRCLLYVSDLNLSRGHKKKSEVFSSLRERARSFFNSTFWKKIYTRQTAHEHQTRGKQRTWKMAKLALTLATCWGRIGPNGANHPLLSRLCMVVLSP